MEDFDQATLDKLVEVLSQSGGGDFKKIQNALYERMDRLSKTISEAQEDGRRTYIAHLAMGGSKYLGFEAAFGVKSTPEPHPPPEEEPEEEPIPDRTTPVFVDTAHGLEIIPPAHKGRSIRGLVSKPRYKGGAYSESGGLSYQEFVAFARLVIDEYGVAPTQRAAAKYFGVSQTAIGRLAHYAEDLGLYEVPSHGRVLPDGFDDMIATRFGRYKPSKPGR